jgi:chaperone BCS1
MFDALWVFANNNEMFSGLVMASLVGGAFFLLRGLPKAVFLWTRLAFTVELEVSNSDDLFVVLSGWFASHPYARRTRRLRVAESGHNETLEPGGRADTMFGLVPGAGWHWFRHDGRWVLYRHDIDRENSRGHFLRQYITLRTFGRSQSSLRDLVAQAVRHKYEHKGVDVRAWAENYWHQIGRKALRPLETVICAEAREILHDARWFFDNEHWYTERGVPYRRGYLFHGEPGTGKTSLVLALASEMGRPIYILNLGSVKGDDELTSAFLSVPAGAILLIEDIDTAEAAGQRRSTNGEAKDEAPRVSLSAMLNAIDGVMAADGRLLVMTSNHPGKLDAALTRPGRVDRLVEFGRIGRAEARAMAMRFYPDTDFDWPGGIDWPAAPATVQAALIRSAKPPS